MTDFDGAIFDLDGTLLESMGVWEEVDRIFLSRRGIEMPDDYSQALTSMHFDQAAAYTIRRFGLRESPEEIIGEWHDLSIEAYSGWVELKKGAERYLRALRQKGVRLGVATSLTPELYLPALKHNGVQGLFAGFACVREAGRGKSFPDVYLLAARRMGVSPGRCMVFEDVAIGLTGAKAGGFLTCGVYDPYSDYEREKIIGLSDWYIESFEQLLP